MKNALKWYQEEGKTWHLVGKSDKNYQNAYTHQEFKKMIYDFNSKEREKLEKDTKKIITKYQLKFT